MQLITDKEAARTLAVSRATLWRRVADGTVPQPVRLGGATRFRADEIAAVVERLSRARDAAA